MSDIAPGTKLSYRSGRADRHGDSTAVVLKTGEVLELRRGQDTASCKRYPTVKDWRATLPMFATVNEVKPTVAAHPDMQRIAAMFAQFGCRWTVSARHSIYSASRADLIAFHEKALQTIQQRLLDRWYHGPNREKVMKTIAEHQAAIAKLREQPDFKQRYFIKWEATGSNMVLYGLDEKGPMEAVGIDVKRGIFAARNPDGTVRIAKRLADLGFRHFFLRVGEKIVSMC